MTISLREVNKKPDYVKKQLQGLPADAQIDVCENGFVVAVLTATELLHTYTDDSGALTLPWVLFGLVGYVLFHMVSTGVFQALTALQVR